MYIYYAEAEVAFGVTHERKGTFDAGVVPTVGGRVRDIDARGRSSNDLAG